MPSGPGSINDGGRRVAKTPAGAAVLDAFQKLGFEYIPGKGMRAVKSKAGGVKPPPTMEIE